MWITQTYLGVVEPDAKLFVYYFFEDYNPYQRDFTEAVQRKLERLGDAFGDQVSILMPNPQYADQIEAEVRQISELSSAVHGQLPGLFLSSKPLAKLTAADRDCIYISFTNTDPINAAEIIQQVRGVAHDKLRASFREPPPEKSFGAILFDSIEVKPGVFGFRIDLKKLFRL